MISSIVNFFLIRCLSQEPHRPWSPSETGGLNAKRPRDDSLLPLVIPVSVPVRRQEPYSPDRDEAALASNWPPRPLNPHDLVCADHKPSVIVTRRRSLRNSLSESSEQVHTYILLFSLLFWSWCTLMPFLTAKFKKNFYIHYLLSVRCWYVGGGKVVGWLSTLFLRLFSVCLNSGY